MKRLRINIAGIVQGVGFRPFVYNLARQFNLTGWVKNNAEGVTIEVEGLPEALAEFVVGLKTETPPLAVITGISSAKIPHHGGRGFVIKHSELSASRQALISPDVATCHDCQRELNDPADRRFGYPFINCTNCGPRYTIIRDIPYDREYITLKEFPVCPACQKEYEDPGPTGGFMSSRRLVRTAGSLPATGQPGAVAAWECDKGNTTPDCRRQNCSDKRNRRLPSGL